MGRHLATTGMFPLPTWRLGDQPAKPALIQQDLDTEWHFKRVVQVRAWGGRVLQLLIRNLRGSLCSRCGPGAPAECWSC